MSLPEQEKIISSGGQPAGNTAPEQNKIAGAAGDFDAADNGGEKQKSGKKGRFFLYRTVLTVSILLTIWGWGALFYCAGLTALVIGFIVQMIILILGVWRIKNLVYLNLLLNIGVLVWFINIKPNPDTIWQIHWRKKPRVKWLNDRQFTVIDIRDFKYRTVDDFDCDYITRTFDLDKLEGMDLAVSHWDGMQNVAHTLLTFRFSDGFNLALSAETRLPFGMDQAAVPGIYKQYEIHYIWSTEDDILKLRSNFRKDELFLYRTAANREQTEKILRYLLNYSQELYEHPKFYNTLTENCTTSLLPAIRQAVPEFKFDYRLIMNGLADKMAYEKGWLAHREGESFAELKKRRLVSQYILGKKPYSEEIRPEGY